MSNPIRVFIAPIADTLDGTWRKIETADDLADARREAIERTEHEEVILADAEGLPQRMMPRYGGVPSDYISAYLNVVDELGSTAAATAYIQALDLVGMYEYAPTDEWARAARQSFSGARDTMKEWAFTLAEQGYFGTHVQGLIADQDTELLDTDQMCSQIAVDSHYFGTFIKIGRTHYRFHTDELTL